MRYVRDGANKNRITQNLRPASEADPCGHPTCTWNVSAAICGASVEARLSSDSDRLHYFRMPYCGRCHRSREEQPKRGSHRGSPTAVGVRLTFACSRHNRSIMPTQGPPQGSLCALNLSRIDRCNFCVPTARERKAIEL